MEPDAHPQARPPLDPPISSTARHMIGVIWAKSPHDRVHHAFPVEPMAQAVERGYAEARCSHTAPSADLERVTAPTTPLCAMCLYEVGMDLVNAGGIPGHLGTC